MPFTPVGTGAYDMVEARIKLVIGEDAVCCNGVDILIVPLDGDVDDVDDNGGDMILVFFTGGVGNGR
jgi:hypothetical protein